MTHDIEILKKQSEERGNKLDFTGERYVSDLDSAQISYEHWHRYLFAAQYVKDKVILDIACGEGYGANLLAQSAKRVVGIDIAQDAIDFAQENYKKDNLAFLRGSADQIPIIENNIFDVIISFETIEHISEEMQKHFLIEVKRLLKHDGIFIVSTPNKLLYSDIPNYQNEYHIKEFYEDEFSNFLKNYFVNVSLLGQKVITGSNIWPLQSELNGLSFSEFIIDKMEQKFEVGNNAKDAIYYIAICYNESIVNLENSYLIDKSMSLITELNQRNADIVRSKERDVIVLKDLLSKESKKLEEKEETLVNIKSEIEEKKDILTELQQSINDKEDTIVSIKNIMQHNANLVDETYRELEKIKNEKLVLKQELDVIYNSNLWKCMRKLAKIKSLILPRKL